MHKNPVALILSVSGRRRGSGLPRKKPDRRVLVDSRNNERLTGGWFGGRAFSEVCRVTIDLDLTAIYRHNAHGGVRTFNAQPSILHGGLR